MICLIDNYDSFTFNLYQYIGEINPQIKVFRNDSVSIDDIKKLSPTHIVISPGPGRPEDAGICVELVQKLSGHIPILGICLGHQAISLAFGGKVDYAPQILHGKKSKIINLKLGILKDLPDVFEAGRYHSLCVPKSSLPDCLKVHAITNDDIVMAMGHVSHQTYGLQFHPESILTTCGKQILHNFLESEGLEYESIT